MLVKGVRAFRVVMKSKQRTGSRPRDWTLKVGGIKDGKFNLMFAGPNKMGRCEATFLTEQDALSYIKSLPHYNYYDRHYDTVVVPTRKEYDLYRIAANEVNVPIYVNAHYIKKRVNEGKDVSIY